MRFKQYLKENESLLTTREEVRDFIRSVSSTNDFIIKDDLSVIFRSSIYIHGEALNGYGGKLPVKFADECDGDFSIDSCNLASLEGCPPIVNGSFDCHDNLRLTSLKDAPEIVHGSVSINNCSLTSLEHFPEVRGRSNFSCRINLRNNPGITSLAGLENKVTGISTLIANNIGITSILGIDNHLKHFFTNTPQSILGSLSLDWDLIKEGGIGLLLIDRLDLLASPNSLKLPKPFQIIARYMKEKGNIFDCQMELIDAGLEAYAEL